MISSIIAYMYVLTTFHLLLAITHEDVNFHFVDHLLVHNLTIYYVTYIYNTIILLWSTICAKNH